MQQTNKTISCTSINGVLVPTMDMTNECIHVEVIYSIPTNQSEVMSACVLWSGQTRAFINYDFLNQSPEGFTIIQTGDTLTDNMVHASVSNIFPYI